MKDFSLKTGDKFVHQKTGGIYVFDGLSYSTKTNNAEVAYHNTLNESFTRDMGEFFGYTEEKKKRFLPLDEFLKENKDQNLEVVENYDGEETIIRIINIFEIKGREYILFSNLTEEISTGKIIIDIGRLSKNNKYYIVETIEDEEEFDEVDKEVDKYLNEINGNL